VFTGLRYCQNLLGFIVQPSSAGLFGAKDLFRIPVLQAAVSDFKLADKKLLKMFRAPEG
jgi:hypothetical protein